MKKGTYIVTGGAGFIGSSFVKKLNQDGISDVVVVDELGTGDKWQNLVKCSYLDFIHKADFLLLAEKGKLPKNTAAIIHMGACSSTTERDADYLMQNNFRYTKVLAESALKKQIRFVYASSAATYGAGEQGYDDAHAGTVALRPLNMYGYSKHLFDRWALETGAIKKIAGIKFFNVYGPNEYHKDEMRSMVQKAWEQIRATGSVKLFRSYRPDFRDGGQKRDFVYIKDCVEVMSWLTKNRTKNGIFNLGSGRARSWNDLAIAVFAALGKRQHIEYIDMPESLQGQYQYFTEAPMEKLIKAGYKQSFTSLEDGVRDYVRNYLETTDPFL